MQKELGLDMEEFREISGKFKVSGKNGKGSEYKLYTNILIFEEEYLNGIKNWKRKEYNYNKGDVCFEGEYLNWVKNGKRK